MKLKIEGYFCNQPVQYTGSFILKMPLNAEILSVVINERRICIFAEIDPEEELRNKVFHKIGTNKEYLIDRDCKFLGTVVMNGYYTYHIYVE